MAPKRNEQPPKKALSRCKASPKFPSKKKGPKVAVEENVGETTQTVEKDEVATQNAALVPSQDPSPSSWVVRKYNSRYQSKPEEAEDMEGCEPLGDHE